MLLPELGIIKKRRKELNLSQKQLAKQAEVSQSLIAKIEAGNIEASYSKIRRIIETLDRLSEKEEKKCSEIMNEKLISVKENELVEKAVRLMKKHQISQLPVIKGGQAVGSISESTILKELENKEQKSLFKQRVKEIMEESFPTVARETPVKSIIPLLKNNPAVLVVEKGRIKGIITKVDVF